MVNNFDTDRASIIFPNLVGSDLKNGLLTNFTSFQIDKQFWRPIDNFIVEIADDRIDQIKNIVAGGELFKFYINDNLQMIGFIDTVTQSYSRNGGNVLHISGRNKLGKVADGRINPFITGTFNVNTTYKQAFQKIFSAYGITTIKEDDDGADFKISSGGHSGRASQTNRVGQPTFTKSKNPSKRALQSFLNKQFAPFKQEGYLEYALRLCKQNGWAITLSPDAETVNIFPPSYDQSIIPYNLVNKKIDNEANNILTGSMKVDFKDLPSAIIAESASYGGPFRLESQIVCQVSDIIGYDNNQVVITNNQRDGTDLSFIIDQFNNKNNILINPNINLQKNIPLSVIKRSKNITDLPVTIAYLFEQNAGSADELQYIVRNKMAHQYEQFFELNYKVAGFSNLNKNVWAINSMVYVIDDNLGINGVYWIEKAVFNKSRSGTFTDLTLKLPFIWDF